MLEKDSLTPLLSRTEYKKQISFLRNKLFDQQRQFREKKKSSLILIIGGCDEASKHDTVNTITDWMDPRGVAKYHFDENNQGEIKRPEFWKYWHTLPAKGEIGIYLGAWYNKPLIQQANKKVDSVTYDQYLSRIKLLEKQLTDDGALIIKLWISISKTEQEIRLLALKENPLTRWRVTKTEEDQATHYNQFKASSDQLLKKTSYPFAQWHLIEDNDAKHRMITAAQNLHNLLNSHITKDSPLSADPISITLPENDNAVITNRKKLKLDLGKYLEKSTYKNKLEKYRGRLHDLSSQTVKKGISTVLVFEGVDAAGKGGAIQRLIVALDAHRYRVVPIAKPTQDEKGYHYLWRFWQNVPSNGMTTIFDRSWYGRVLVERIEGFATTDEWRRAYSEINDFEEQLFENNTVVIKFWIQISKDEQLKRFRARENTPHKKWKINEEDWRNREKWEQYEEAVEDMIRLTNTNFAPWTMVEGNDKRFARVKVIKTVCDQLHTALKN